MCEKSIFVLLLFLDTFLVIYDPESVNQLGCLSMSSKHKPSAPRADHQFLDDRLRCDPVIRIRRSGMINHQAEN